jgi:hypothetical protein
MPEMVAWQVKNTEERAWYVARCGIRLLRVKLKSGAMKSQMPVML